MFNFSSQDVRNFRINMSECPSIVVYSPSIHLVFFNVTVLDKHTEIIIKGSQSQWKKFYTFHSFTNHNFRMNLKWKVNKGKKIKHLFHLKDWNPHPSCMIYECMLVWWKLCWGNKTKNAEIRWDEHNIPNKDSEPSKQISQITNLNGKCYLQLLIIIKWGKHFITIRRASLNEQLEHKNLILFKHAITQFV